MLPRACHQSSIPGWHTAATAPVLSRGPCASCGLRHNRSLGQHETLQKASVSLAIPPKQPCASVAPGKVLEVCHRAQSLPSAFWKVPSNVYALLKPTGTISCHRYKGMPPPLFLTVPLLEPSLFSQSFQTGIPCSACLSPLLLGTLIRFLAHAPKGALWEGQLVPATGLWPSSCPSSFANKKTNQKSIYTISKASIWSQTTCVEHAPCVFDRSLFEHVLSLLFSSRMPRSTACSGCPAG